MDTTSNTQNAPHGLNCDISSPKAGAACVCGGALLNEPHDPRCPQAHVAAK